MNDQNNIMPPADGQPQYAQTYDPQPMPQYDQPYQPQPAPQYGQPYQPYQPQYMPPIPSPSHAPAVVREVPKASLVLAIISAALFMIALFFDIVNYGLYDNYLLTILADISGYALIIVGIVMCSKGKPMFAGIGAFCMAMTYMIYLLNQFNYFYIGSVGTVFYIIMHLTTVSAFILIGLYYVLNGKAIGAPVKNAMAFVFIGVIVTKFLYQLIGHISMENMLSNLFGYVSYGVLLSIAFIKFTVNIEK